MSEPGEANHGKRHRDGPTSGERDFDADGDLLEMLAEAEAHVERLRNELERRRQQRVDLAEQAAQHAEIARLAEHLEQAQVNWQKVREFFRSAISEYRAGLNWSDPRTVPAAEEPSPDGNIHGDDSQERQE